MVGLGYTIQVYWGYVAPAGYALPVLAQVAMKARRTEGVAPGARITVGVSFVAIGPVRATPIRLIVGLMLRAFGELLTLALDMGIVRWALLELERVLDRTSQESLLED